MRDLTTSLHSQWDEDLRLELLDALYDFLPGLFLELAIIDLPKVPHHQLP